ncbi:MAG TPA: homoserine dehydrogenase [Solibacterales bacterium]|nr:homoserine dehydrogenase [Bryobacterales bacterium]
MRLALIGYGNVAKAFARLLERKRGAFPFRICGIHTRRGTAVGAHGLKPDAALGAPLASVEHFLDEAEPEIVLELTTLNPASGEPAISHIRAAFARGLHVVTANKGPIAHAYAALRDEARARGVLFRFESTCMDGAPVFNMFRNDLPGVEVLGFTGALNSTSKIVIDALRRGSSLEDGIAEAQRLGVAEADASFDVDGWDSAAKAAALANVLMDARLTPLDVDRRGIGKLTPEKMAELSAKGKTVVLVSRGKRTPQGVKLRVRAEVVDETDLLASARGTSNLLLVHTDLMGTVGTVSLDPGVEQTAYGVFGDVVDIAKNA